MSLRTFSVGHSLKDGFTLHLEERSLFREVVGNWIDSAAHAVLPGSWAWDVCQGIFHWQDKKTKTLERILIEYEDAVVLSEPGVWEYTTEA